MTLQQDDHNVAKRVPESETPTLKSDKLTISRRQFMGVLGSTLLPAMVGCREKKAALNARDIPGEVVGASAQRGHVLRFGSDFPLQAQTEEIETLIIGAGVSGLSAAWRLTKGGMRNFKVIDLEDLAGGTARHGQNKISKYPWGAHYLPAPPEEARGLRAMLQEFGVIIGTQQDGTPLYNPNFICPSLEERVFESGLWREGLWPKLGETKTDQAELNRFQKIVATFIGKRGGDGRKAFTLPLAECSRDPQFVKLDKISAKQWLDENNFQSQRLRWFIEYGVRDDYGGLLDNVSAWAMFHYHVARKTKEHHFILTFPEGNGWFVDKLLSYCPNQFEAKQLVRKITPLAASKGDAKSARWQVTVVDFATNKQRNIVARNVIFSAPKYIVPYLFDNYPDAKLKALKSYHYAPWVVANLTLKRLPGGFGAAPAWDNVIYNSPSLGYVVATHSQRNKYKTPTVLTYYWPLPATDTVASRKKLHSQSREDWCEKIVADLQQAHPQILPQIQRLDVCFWGHAMIRPSVDFLFNPQRSQALPQAPGMFFAGADVSGMPFFEEAHYQGVAAAEAILRETTGTVASIL